MCSFALHEIGVDQVYYVLSLRKLDSTSNKLLDRKKSIAHEGYELNGLHLHH